MYDFLLELKKVSIWGALPLFVNVIFVIITLTKAGVASNADTSSRGSKAIAKRVVDILVEEQQHKINMVEKISGQTLGKQFEMLTMEFLQATFPNLQNLYPGKWSILQLGKKQFFTG